MAQKRKKLISVISLIILFIFVVSLLSGALFGISNASSLNAQLQDAKKAKAAAQQELAGVQSKKSAAQTDKNKLDSEISQIQSQINTIESQLAATASEITQKEADLAVAQQRCDEQLESYKTRARVMYEKGPSTYLEVLFGSTSFSDFISNIEIVKSIMEYDQKVLNERREAMKQIENAKAELERIKQEQELSRQTLSEMKDTLSIKQQAQAQVVDQLASQEDALKKKIAAQEAEEARVQALINQGLAAQSNSSGTYQSGTGTMLWPCPSTKYITSYFGGRQSPTAGASTNHKGVDIGGMMGANIVAADSGTVMFSGNSSSYGKYIVLSHGNGITTLYAHCSALLVNAGQSVKKGDVIARVGSTGISNGPHLHFEVSVNGVRQNPLNYVG